MFSVHALRVVCAPVCTCVVCGVYMRACCVSKKNTHAECQMSPPFQKATVPRALTHRHTTLYPAQAWQHLPAPNQLSRLTSGGLRDSRSWCLSEGRALQEHEKRTGQRFAERVPLKLPSTPAVVRIIILYGVAQPPTRFWQHPSQL